MRGIGRHIPPAQMQPEPSDNTSDAVMVQVRTWANAHPMACCTSAIGPECGHVRGTGVTLIHTESAREIASWWQTSRKGDGFQAFAGSGEILPSLVEEIEWELPRVTGDEWTPKADNEAALRALLAYVKACG